MGKNTLADRGVRSWSGDGAKEEYLTGWFDVAVGVSQGDALESGNVWVGGLLKVPVVKHTY